jgi:hypothetical protein
MVQLLLAVISGFSTILHLLIIIIIIIITIIIIIIIFFGKKSVLMLSTSNLSARPITSKIFIIATFVTMGYEQYFIHNL